MNAVMAGDVRFGAGALTFAADEVGLTFLALFAFLWTLSGAYAWASVPTAERRRFFAWYVPAAIGGVAVALAADAVSFYLCFALMALPSWGLITHSGTAESRRAGAVYLTLTVLGEALLLGGLMLLAARAGSLELAALRVAAVDAPLALGMAAAAIALKVGALPASGVLPLSYVHAPAGAASALAGASVKVGALAMVRLLPFGAGLAEWQAALVVLGAVTAFVAALLGVLTTSPRAVLGYSSASQMGLVTIAAGAGLGSPEAASLATGAIVAYSLHHGLAKSALVLGDDLVCRRAGRARRTAIAALILPALALVGVPFTSGFVAKYALKDAVHAMSAPLGHTMEALLPWMAVGTAALMLRFLALVRGRVAHGESGGPGAIGSVHAQRAVVALWATLLLAVALTCWLWPAEWSGPAAKVALKPSALWAALWPLLVAVAAAAATVRVVRSAALRRGVVPPGDLLAGVADWLGARPLGSRALRAATGESAARRAAGRLIAGALHGESRLLAWPVSGFIFVALVIVAALLVMG